VTTPVVSYNILLLPFNGRFFHVILGQQVPIGSFSICSSNKPLEISISGNEFYRPKVVPVIPTISVEALKTTQSTNSNQWHQQPDS